MKVITQSHGTKENGNMGLKAPGLLTFMLSVILTVCILVVKFFEAQIPLIQGNEFWALLVAHVILLLGCVMSRI